MKITQEQKNAIEYLEKYTKWETYGERNLEKDIITVLNLVKKLQKENKELKIKEFQLHLATEEMKSMIYKQKVKEKIEELEKAYEDSKDEYGESKYYYPDYTINILQELLEESEE